MDPQQTNQSEHISMMAPSPSYLIQEKTIVAPKASRRVIKNIPHLLLSPT
jgi:hypothetical protein